jgi:hypothetical protein
MSLSTNRHPPLLHGFEKGGLSFRTGTINFIGEHKIRKERSLLKNEVVGA